MKYFWITFLFAIQITYAQITYAQNTGAISGTILDKNSQETLIGATLSVEGTELGTSTDIDGSYRVEGIPVGSYNIVATYVGYKSFTKFNIVVTSGNDNIINFQMEEESVELEGAVVTSNRSISITTAENPNSIQRLSTEEIKANPGGNFDISRVIQTLPGVAGAIGVGGFRNDIIIRGGAPNENVYYLDGIEVPVINHFSTQGSAGGPQGMLNVSFIEGVTLSTSSMHARYDNALSSVLQFDQRTGNPDKFQGNFRISSTEAAVTLEGPIKDKITYLVSARRSYLELLFEAIDLPIRPNYWDFQYKVNYKLNKKTSFNFIGLGSLDEFSFAVPKNTSPDKEYILRSSPLINQWSYTTGASMKHLIDNGFINVALSRNMFENRLDKFADGNDGVEEFRTLKSKSQEIENKLRLEVNKYNQKWKYSYGASIQYVKYNADFYSKLPFEIEDPVSGEITDAITFDSEIDFAKFGLFGQVSRRLLDDRLNISLGTRVDMNTFTTTGMNPLRTLSYRLGASYQINNKWAVNASSGSYYKVPIYTILGYQDEAGNFVNKDNKYTESFHYVVGTEFIPNSKLRFTVESFYKSYNNYPVSVGTGISLANLGGGFGAIGNEKVTTIGKGRTYGIEFFAQQKLTKNVFAVFSYTGYKSEFSGLDGEYIPSAWDYGHIISATLGYKFKKGWEVGLKYRFAAGAPYTPFDMAASLQNYYITGEGVLDYSQLNSQKLPTFNQVDIRIDKKWNFKRATFDLYLDVTNALNFVQTAVPRYTWQRTEDNSDWLTTDGNMVSPDGSNASPLLLDDESRSTIPSLGFIIEF
jgi:hypothetical protein